MGPLPEGLPPEDIYGRRKKAAFICDAVSSLALERGRPLDILDFGCGNGTQIAQHLVRLDVRLTGVDLHQPSLEYASAHFGSSNATFVSSVPGDQDYDVIVYADILEHLDNPRALLLEHRKILRKGGVIIGSVPNGFGAYEIESWLDRKLGLSRLYDWTDSAYRRLRHQIGNWIKTKVLRRTLVPAPPLDNPLPYNLESPHVRFFTAKAFQKLLQDAGYQLQTWGHSTVIGAQFTGRIFWKHQGFLNFNARMADKFPRALVAGWMFMAR